jgi:hypothetical protein
MKTMARAQDATEIARRLRTLRPDSPRRWGKMTANQMICHLIDACRMALGEQSVSRKEGGPPPVVIKWIALYLPFRWPQGIDTRPEIDQLCAGTQPGQFDADVAQLAKLLERMTQVAANHAWPVHPIFGAMSRRAWMRWGYLHADHHLRQFGA